MMSALKQSSVFDLQRIERQSPVRQIVFRRTVGSTNDLALRLAARQQLRTQVLVLAEEQTAGRGRGTNRWWSGRGALTFSLLLDATHARVQAEHWPRVSLAAAVAVSKTVRELAPNACCGIRWPNDVYAAGRKICGILPELAPSPGLPPQRLVLGIGINVNNRFAHAPADVRCVGVSLTELTARNYDLTTTLLDVLARLECELDRLARDDPALAHAWTGGCLLRGRTVALEIGSRRVRGICRGIDRDGALLLQTGLETGRFFSGVVAAVE